MVIPSHHIRRVQRAHHAVERRYYYRFHFARVNNRYRYQRTPTQLGPSRVYHTKPPKMRPYVCLPFVNRDLQSLFSVPRSRDGDKGFTSIKVDNSGIPADFVSRSIPQNHR
jgi:hypothetical protein